MEPETLAEWSELTEGVTSQIGIVECHRGLFHALAMKRLTGASLPAAQEAIEAMLDRLRIVRFSRAVIEDASRPLPVNLGALDAIHLASAIQYRTRRSGELIHFATHDRRLAEAARAMNFPVLGSPKATETSVR